MEKMTARAVLRRYERARERRRHWESHWEFSCWNANDPNRALIESVAPGDKVFDICRRVARRALRGLLADPTNGATHYHTKAILPRWARAQAPVAEIGEHLFYRLEG